jgi:hypothetical protein
MNSFPHVRLVPAWQRLLILPGGALISAWVSFENIHRHSGKPIYMAAAISAGVFAGICLLKLLTSDIWVVERDKLRIESLLGILKKMIPVSEIHSWSETPVNAWCGGGFVLTLYTKQGNIKLFTRWYNNYYPIRAILCHDAKHRAPGRENK